MTPKGKDEGIDPHPPPPPKTNSPHPCRPKKKKRLIPLFDISFLCVLLLHYTCICLSILEIHFIATYIISLFSCVCFDFDQKNVYVLKSIYILIHLCAIVLKRKVLYKHKHDIIDTTPTENSSKQNNSIYTSILCNIVS